MSHQVHLVNVVVDKLNVVLECLFVHVSRRRIRFKLGHGFVGFDPAGESVCDPVPRRHADSNVTHLPKFTGLLESVNLCFGVHRGRITALVIANHEPCATFFDGLHNPFAYLDGACQRLLDEDRDSGLH